MTALCLGIIFVTFQPTFLLKEKEKHDANIRLLLLCQGNDSTADEQGAAAAGAIALDDKYDGEPYQVSSSLVHVFSTSSFSVSLISTALSWPVYVIVPPRKMPSKKECGLLFHSVAGNQAYLLCGCFFLTFPFFSTPLGCA